MSYGTVGVAEEKDVASRGSRRSTRLRVCDPPCPTVSSVCCVVAAGVGDVQKCLAVSFRCPGGHCSSGHAVAGIDVHTGQSASNVCCGSFHVENGSSNIDCVSGSSEVNGVCAAPSVSN